LSLKRQKTSELLAQGGQSFFVPAIDEFGGYSSRLRIPEVISSTGAPCRSGSNLKLDLNGPEE